MRFADENEVLLHRVRKTRGTLLFMAVFFPIWLYFGFQFFLIPSFKALFLGNSSIALSEVVIAGLIGLVVFLPVILLILLSYSLNSLVFTDQRIYIRKGISGKTQIINLADVRSFQHVYSTSSRGSSSHKILFYLSCGMTVKTGELFATFFGLQGLLAFLRERFEGKGFTRHELQEMKSQSGGECRITTKRNVFAPLLLVLPFALAIVLTGLYLTGAL